MQYFHNATWGKWLAFIFAFIIEVLLGVNVYFLVKISTEAVFPDTGVLSTGVAALFGFGIFIGGMWVFLYAEYSFKAAHAYSQAMKTAPWREIIVILMVLGVIGLDITSLFFRREYLSNRGADWLFWFFVILALLPPAIGVVLHVLVNKPMKVRYAEAYQRIHSTTIDQLEREMPNMSLEHKLRFLSGDQEALTEHLGAKQERQSVIEAAKSDQQARDEAEKEQMSRPFFQFFQPKNQQERVSMNQNGRMNQ